MKYKPEHQNILAAIQTGNLDRAGEECSRRLQTSPEDAVTHLLAGAVANRLGRHEESVRYLHQAAKHAAGNRQILSEVITALLNLRAYSDARGLLETRADLSDPGMMLALARCCWYEGEYPRSLHIFEQLLSHLPGSGEIADFYSRALIYMGRWDEAAFTVDDLLQRQPANRHLRARQVRIELSRLGLTAAIARLDSQAMNGSGDELDLLACALKSAACRELRSPLAIEPKWKSQWEGLETVFPLMPQYWVGDNPAVLRQAIGQAPPEGVLVECGVFHGLSINLMASWAPDREIHGFDSFQGLSAEWEAQPAGSYSTRGRIPEVASNVQLHPGWFHQTLPAFVRKLDRPIAVLHIDCDIYEATKDVLEAVGPALEPGAIVIFDEFTGYTGWRNHEYRAWNEFLQATQRSAESVAAVLLGPKYAARLLD